MDINNLKDIAFSMTYSEGRNQEINFSFIYNLYNENETQIPDDTILKTDNISKNKFIRIELENSVDNHDRFSFTENGSLSFIYDLSDRDLYEKEREFFNKIDNLIPVRSNLTTDYKFKEIKDFFTINKSFNSDIDEDAVLNLDRSNNLSILPISQYIEKFNSKELVESFNYNNILDYEKLINNEKVIEERNNKKNFITKFKTGNLLPGLFPISTSINTGDPNIYANLNAFYCGRYLEKFILKDDDSYRFLCSRFFINKKEGTVDKSIEDEAIKYGETYRYVHYNVYLYTTVDTEDRFKLNHYLLCDYPYMSNDLLCKEFDNPPEPVALTAFYDKLNKKMMLEWQLPTNYEGDVKGFQIFKRFSLDEPFTLLKQLEGHLDTDLYEFEENVLDSDKIKTPGDVITHFHDELFDSNRMCIYTVRSIDAHGMLSNFGEQVSVYYDMLRDKLITNLTARSGADVLYPNSTVLNKSLFFEDMTNIIDNLPLASQPKKISLYITPDFGSITSKGIEQKTLDGEYQFTFMNLNDNIYRSDKFTINNFG